MGLGLRPADYVIRAEAGIQSLGMGSWPINFSSRLHLLQFLVENRIGRRVCFCLLIERGQNRPNFLVDFNAIC